MTGDPNSPLSELDLCGDAASKPVRSVLPSFLRFPIENAEFVPFFVHFK